jgi:hypothetical protein
VLEKSHARNESGTHCGGPKIPTLIVSGGNAKNISFPAVFGIGALFVGFDMDQCYHANGHKGMFFVVMLLLDMCMHRKIWVHTRLPN